MPEGVNVECVVHVDEGGGGRRVGNVEAVEVTPLTWALVCRRINGGSEMRSRSCVGRDDYSRQRSTQAIGVYSVNELSRKVPR